MCGIVGFIGKNDVTHYELIESLKKLEYRGYDSAGIAVAGNSGLKIEKRKGKIKDLAKKILSEKIKGRAGIGHTRWATHGAPSDKNAHPHSAGDIALVHNGIIENYVELKQSLEAEGHTFKTETDTEVICHLIQRYLFRNMPFDAAVRNALKQLKGSYAVAILYKKDPNLIVASKKESPLVIGIGKDGNCLASDIPAILNYTRDVVFMEDGDFAILRPNRVEFFDLDGNPQKKRQHTIEWSPAMAEKGGYKHFMLKEIFEQPRAITDTFRGRISAEIGEVHFEQFDPSPEELERIKKIVIVACGTSYHAGLVGKFLIEELGKIPVEVDYGSEFRYRNPLVDENTLMILISQSGETADTLAGLRGGKEKKAKTLAICNVVGSSIARESEAVIFTHAGPEISVASTKAFTTQLTILYLLAIKLGRLTSLLTDKQAKKLIDDLMKVPHQVEEVLNSSMKIREIGEKYMHCTNFLYLGRGINYPLALEGALKLKEISYIHAEGYPAGEMKHGPIALIDVDVPTVVIATKHHTHKKLLSNIEEVRSRKGPVIAVVTDNEREVPPLADDCITVPRNNHMLMPIISAVALQLFAYHIADLKGTDVDQPRNLAKSVTVE